MYYGRHGYEGYGRRGGYADAFGADLTQYRGRQLTYARTSPSTWDVTAMPTPTDNMMRSGQLTNEEMATLLGHVPASDRGTFNPTGAPGGPVMTARGFEVRKDWGGGTGGPGQKLGGFLGFVAGATGGALLIGGFWPAFLIGSVGSVVGIQIAKRVA